MPDKQNVNLVHFFEWVALQCTIHKTKIAKLEILYCQSNWIIALTEKEIVEQRALSSFYSWKNNMLKKLTNPSNKQKKGDQTSVLGISHTKCALFSWNQHSFCPKSRVGWASPKDFCIILWLHTEFLIHTKE